jgi:hypothetical protein
VGQWAVNLGLSDGGPGFKVGSGNPILPAWRSWARPIAPELGPAFETEVMETEIVHDATPSGPGIPTSRAPQSYARMANARMATPPSGHSECGCGGKATPGR